MEINYPKTELIERTFSREGVVVLNDFFAAEYFKRLKGKIKQLKFKKDFELLHHSYYSAELSIDSGGLTDFLSRIINKKIRKLQFNALKLTWKDYMILNDKYLDKSGIDIIIDITKNWDEKWGGLFTYTDGLGNYVQVPPAENSLTIVKRKKGMNGFINYINHYAKKKERIVLIAKLQAGGNE